LLYVPHTQHAVVGKRDNVVGYLSTNHLKPADRILVGICRDSRTLHGHRLYSYIPHENLAIVATSEHSGA